MTIFLFALLGLNGFLAQHVHTVPTTPLDAHLFGHSLDVFDTLNLFDAPAFQEPVSGAWTATISAFVSLRQIDLAPVINRVFDTVFRDLGVEIGDRAATFAGRVQLFSAIGQARKNVDVAVTGCDAGTVRLNRTAGLPDLGYISQRVALGSCNTTTTPLVGRVRVDGRVFTANIFPSPPEGFGVISGEWG